MGSSSSLAISPENSADVNDKKTFPRTYVIRRSSPDMQSRSTSGASFKPASKRSRKIHQKSLAYQRSNLISVERDSLKKEYEMFRLHTQNEISSLEKVKKKLTEENQRLRAELQALEKMIIKLKAERDQAFQAEMRALERASAFELDRNKIQKQFKIYRETRESELQHILKTIQDQEIKLKTDSGMKPLSKKNELCRGSNEGPVLQKWASLDSDASNDSGTIAPYLPFTKSGDSFTLLMELETSVGDFLKTDVEWFQSKSMLCKNSETNSSVNDVVLFVSGFNIEDSSMPGLFRVISALEYECEKFGKILRLIFESFNEIGESHSTSAMLKKTKIVSETMLFIALLNDNSCESVIDELFCPDSAQQNSTKIVIVATDSFDDVSKRVRSRMSERVELVQCSSFNNDTLESLASKLCDKAKQCLDEKIDKETQQSTGVNSYLELELLDCQRFTSGLFWDVLEESIQDSLLYNGQQLPETALVKSQMNCLTSHVIQPGPVSPLLVLGPPGSGRSGLLTNWASLMQEHFVIVHYLVRTRTSNTSSPKLLVRRILIQMLEKINSSSVLSSNDLRMKAEFPIWLEKIASKLDLTAVVILDSIDLCLNIEDELSWLLDPLPINIRIIISCDPHYCPSSWCSWPTLNLEPFSTTAAECLLNHELNQAVYGIKDETKHIIQRKFNELGKETTFLFCDVFCRAVRRFEINGKQETLLNMLLECNLTEDLFAVILEDLIESFSSTRECKSILQTLAFIRASCEGLNASDLPFLMPRFNLDWWIALKEDLVFYRILTDCCGILYFAHTQAVTAVDHVLFQNRQMDNREHKHKLVQYYMSRLKMNYYIPSHVVDDLLKLLRELNHVEKIVEMVNNIWIFFSLYTRGRTSELQCCLDFASVDYSTTIVSYLSSLKQLEEDISNGKVQLDFRDVAIIYESVGVYLRDLCQLSEAVHPLQRTLELRETTLDPDHPLVADALHQLATLYCQWGKFSTAETLLKQALDIYEMTFGKDNYFSAKELNSLVVLYQQMGKIDIATAMQEQLLLCKKLYSSPCLYRTITGSVQRITLELPINEMSDEAASSLLEMGMRQFCLHNYRLAEKYLTCALEMQKSLRGEISIHYSQLLNNLAGTLLKQKNLKKAETLYKEALNIRLQLLPLDSPSISAVVTRLGSVYQQQGKLDDLVALYNDLLDQRERKLGPSHPCTASTMVNLAVLFSQQNNYSNALALYEDALKIFNSIYGECHPQVITTMKNLALLHYEQGYSTVAANLYKKASEINILTCQQGGLMQVIPSLLKRHLPLAVTPNKDNWN